jgi:DNA-directed RNA polymerase
VTNRVLKQDFALVLRKMQQIRRQCRAALIDATITGRRLGGWEHRLEALDSESVAFIAFKTLLTTPQGTSRTQDVATAIGRAIDTEVRWQQARRAEAKSTREREGLPPNRIEMMKRRVKAVEPKSVRKWLKMFDDIADTQCARSVMFKMGSIVLAGTLEVLPHVAVINTYKTSRHNRSRTVQRVDFTPEFLARVGDMHSREAVMRPWLLPTVEAPRDWEFSGQDIRGGYHHMDYRPPNVEAVAGKGRHTADDVYVGAESFIKQVGGRKGHTKPSKDTVSQKVLDAVNLIQATPWKINPYIVDLAKMAIDKGKGPLPYEGMKELPTNIPADEWAKMTTEQRGVHKSKREAVHSHNNRQQAKSLSTHRVLQTAMEFAEYPQIWFPHNIDWRGRSYPLPQDLHPQADDFAKAMLTFAEGKPLGEHGLKWLVFHLANCYGMDKGSREDQAEWYNNHTDDVFKVASDPLGEGLEFWSQADEPWQFLAAAIEVCQAFVLSNPEDYVSHLPVHIDGSCNGLQHLSAMGLDPVGGQAVNLLPGPRQDIYQIVADKVVDAVEDDVAKLEEHGFKAEAHAWSDNVTRKTVKRGVMTTPYGLTAIGMRDQLIQDGWVRDLEGDPMSNANYMRDRMQEAIGDTIIKGTEIMKWFQDCAEILAEQDKAISWTTPVGLRVTQCYRQITGKRIRTLVGYLNLNTGEGGTIAKRKQVMSIAPNIIHSFDAAHMMLTVLDTKDQGLSYSVIHDSFGTHAGDMEQFAYSTRASFAQMYKNDYFWQFDNDFRQQGAKHLTPMPERGLLDIEQVVDAEFFFA